MGSSVEIGNSVRLGEIFRVFEFCNFHLGVWVADWPRFMFQKKTLRYRPIHSPTPKLESRKFQNSKQILEFYMCFKTLRSSTIMCGFLLKNNQDSAICLCKDIRETNCIEVTLAYSGFFSYENYFLRQLNSIF